MVCVIWIILSVTFIVLYYWFGIVQDNNISEYGISRESFNSILSILAPLVAAFLGVLIASVVIVAQHFINSIRHCRDSLSEENEWLVQFLNEYESDDFDLVKSLTELSDICSVATTHYEEHIDISNVDDVTKNTLDGFNRCQEEITAKREKIEQNLEQVETTESQKAKVKENNDEYIAQVSDLAKQIRSFKAINRHLYRIHSLLSRLFSSVASYAIVKNLAKLAAVFSIFLLIVIACLLANNIEFPSSNEISNTTNDNIQISATDDISETSTTTTTFFNDSARLLITIYLILIVLVGLFFVTYDAIRITLDFMSQEVGKLKEPS